MTEIPKWVRDLDAIQREIPFGSLGFTLHDGRGAPQATGSVTKYKNLVGKMSVDKAQSFKFDHPNNTEAVHLIEQIIKSSAASGFTGTLGLTLNFKQNPEGTPSLINQVVKTEHEEIIYS